MQAHPFLTQLELSGLTSSQGRVIKVNSTHIVADGPQCAIGSICSISPKSSASLSDEETRAEVVAIEEDHIVLIPLHEVEPILPEAEVMLLPGKEGRFHAGDAYSGRAINGLGDAIDGRGGIARRPEDSMMHKARPALERIVDDTMLPTGICVVDALLSLARGQRIGMFAPAGVGKTTLMQQLARQVEADRIVICLVGERGQEVSAMWQICQSMPDPEKFTLVASTSDESATMRARAPELALALAEHWRNQGNHILLIVDSITRMAMALREIGLASGQPPTVRAYTPNVFSAIPRFVERCGAIQGSGAITAVMTVLAESEEVDDPVCEMMKSVLDGHIILSRTLAEQGQFPAIDINRSVSRHASKIITVAQHENVQLTRKMLALYDESRTLVESGIYQKGSNSEIDEAIRLKEKLTEFAKQADNENIPAEHSMDALDQLLREGP